MKDKIAARQHLLRLLSMPRGSYTRAELAEAYKAAGMAPRAAPKGEVAAGPVRPRRAVQTVDSDGYGTHRPAVVFGEYRTRGTW